MARACGGECQRASGAIAFEADNEKLDAMSAIDIVDEGALHAVRKIEDPLQAAKGARGNSLLP